MFSARRLNDGMGDYVANQVIKLMNKKGVMVKDAKILILGITFKENCPDIRNTKIVDIFQTLQEYTSNITIYDPWADVSHVTHEYGITIYNGDYDSLKGNYDAVILGVAHNEFMNKNIRELLKNTNDGVVYDVKCVIDRNLIDGRL